MARHTRLLALEDKMIVRASEEEKKRKREEQVAQEQKHRALEQAQKALKKT